MSAFAKSSDELDLTAFATLLEDVEAGVKAVDASEKELKSSLRGYKVAKTDGEKKKAKESAKSAHTTLEKDKKNLDDVLVAGSKKTGLSKKSLTLQAKDYIKGKNSALVEKIFKCQQTISLCFVLDATGSMHAEYLLSGVKTTIRSMIGKLQRSMEHMQIELACVVYRDVGDTDRFEIHDFSTSITAFEQFLNKVKAGGGSDQCEDVIGGLAKAAEMNFRCANKIVILCGDAPCHGSQYHDGCGDRFPSGDFPGEQDGQSILTKLDQKGIQICFLKCNSTTDKMIAKFKQWMPLLDDENEIDVENVKSIPDCVRNSVMGSIRKSVAATGTTLRGKHIIPDKSLDAILETSEDTGEDPEEDGTTGLTAAKEPTASSLCVDDDESIDQLCEKFRLKGVASKLKNLGATTAEDLVDFNDEDFEHLDLQVLEKRRFQKLLNCIRIP